MQPTVETIIESAAVTPATPEAIVAALDSHAQPTHGGWLLTFHDGPFDSATAEVEGDDQFSTLRLTFHVRGQGLQLNAISSYPERWIAGPLLPDTGRCALSLDWPITRVNLEISCNVVVESADTAADDLIHKVVCFISSP